MNDPPERITQETIDRIYKLLARHMERITDIEAHARYENDQRRKVEHSVKALSEVVRVHDHVLRDLSKGTK